MNAEEVRYYGDDPVDTSRILYQNGEYYRIGLDVLNGGNPYVVPTHQIDPWSPATMRHPEPYPLHYYEDLDLKYHQIMKEKITQFHTHYERLPENTPMAAMPISSTVQFQMISSITINFMSADMNYTTKIEPGKVYRIDYVEDAVLKTVIGKVPSVKRSTGIDFRNATIDYAVIKVDCSADFERDERYVDSRWVRYIKCLSDLQTNTIVTRTYVGVESPSSEEYGGWFNTSTGKYMIYNQTTGKWETAPDKPTEKVPAGKEWFYDETLKQWIIRDIPNKGEGTNEPTTAGRRPTTGEGTGGTGTTTTGNTGGSSEPSNGTGGETSSNTPGTGSDGTKTETPGSGVAEQPIEGLGVHTSSYGTVSGAGSTTGPVQPESTIPTTTNGTNEGTKTAITGSPVTDGPNVSNPSAVPDAGEKGTGTGETAEGFTRLN